MKRTRMLSHAKIALINALESTYIYIYIFNFECVFFRKRGGFNIPSYCFPTSNQWLRRILSQNFKFKTFSCVSWQNNGKKWMTKEFVHSHEAAGVCWLRIAFPPSTHSRQRLRPYACVLTQEWWRPQLDKHLLSKPSNFVVPSPNGRSGSRWLRQARGRRCVACSHASQRVPLVSTANLWANRPI